MLQLKESGHLIGGMGIMARKKPEIFYGLWFCCLDCGVIFVTGNSRKRYCNKCKNEIEKIFPSKPYGWETRQ